MEISLQFKGKKDNLSYVIKIKARPEFFNKYFNLPDLGLSNCIINKHINKKENFVLNLESYKVEPEICCSAAKIFVRLNGKSFLFSTPRGSFIKGNFTKGCGEGKIIGHDNFRHSLLRRTLNYCFLYNLSARLHAAMIETEDKIFLLAGHGEVGKSTLSGLLKKNKEYKVLHDDICFIAPTQKKVRVFSLTPDKSGRYDFSKPKSCTSLLFIELRKKEKSRLYPISKKEAFKRIIFLSEFPDYENDRQRTRRIESLGRLVSQSRCFSLINGKGLLMDPDKLKYLISPALI